MLLALIATLITACSAADMRGVNLGGFLLIEEWMFSNVKYYLMLHLILIF